MESGENERFTAYLLGAVREAERLKYYPSRFKKMLNAYGGFETVKRVLATGKISDGFTELQMLDRINLTCEAIVVESEWRPHFDGELLQRAEATLRSVGYVFKRYEGASASTHEARKHAIHSTHDRRQPSDQYDDEDDPIPGSDLRINAFFQDVLHAPVLNARWSWGSVDERTRRVFLRLWREEVVNQGGAKLHRVLGDPSKRPGWSERARHVDLIKSGYAAFAILCEKGTHGGALIQSFDRDRILVLGDVHSIDDRLYMDVVDTIPVDALVSPSKRPELIEQDLGELRAADIKTTTRMALVDARLGQGRYRRELLRRWNGACAVTGCRVGAMLRASHCKPWRHSDNRERLDSNNGLVLTANLDALFDAGLVSFDDQGRMLLAGGLSPQERDALGLPANLLRAPSRELRRYLEFHRDSVFLKKYRGF